MESEKEQVDYDVIIVGAGISGINFAYRLKERCPELSYCILEGRNEIGGTWSFFKYPGLRSDSDLNTFGFAWRPWKQNSPIAEAPQILSYLKEAAAAEGLDRAIRFRHRVESMDWSSSSRTWAVDVAKTAGDDDAAAAERLTLRSRFVLLGTGYYDYDEPLRTEIPGLDSWAGGASSSSARARRP
ncbi:hypothetical protein CDD83_2565 [Cordyceps sp. RAO-2017]|nr:hypothetical protein CDD83_2565 [Cordyceps sp. RAO-2017]